MARPRRNQEFNDLVETSRQLVLDTEGHIDRKQQTKVMTDLVIERLRSRPSNIAIELASVQIANTEIKRQRSHHHLSFNNQQARWMLLDPYACIAISHSVDVNVSEAKSSDWQIWLSNRKRRKVQAEQNYDAAEMLVTSIIGRLRGDERTANVLPEIIMELGTATERNDAEESDSDDDES